MKNIKYLTAIMIVLLFVTSCKKDDPEEIIPEVMVDKYEVKVNDVELKNNDVWLAPSSGEAGDMIFAIKNISSEKIGFNIKVISIDGVDGSNIQLCMGSCFQSISAGSVYPGGTGYLLDPGVTSQSGETHIKNKDNRSESFECVLKLYQVDENGLELTSEKSVQFTYKYDAP